MEEELLLHSLSNVVLHLLGVCNFRRWPVSVFLRRRNVLCVAAKDNGLHSALANASSN